MNNNNLNNNYSNNGNSNYYNSVNNINNGLGGNNANYLVGQPVKKKGNGAVKAIIAVFSVLLVVIVAVIIGVVLFFFLGNSKSEKVEKLMDKGQYSEAFNRYVELYGRGNSDDELDAAIYDRLLKIKENHENGTIDYEQAQEELEVIEDMKIEKFEDEISEIRELINSKKFFTDPNISTKPEISDATTLVGEVLSASNVNAARSFGANKAIDGYYESCWCVNTTGTGGSGAQIRFSLSEKSYVSGFKIINGNLYKPETDIYSLNGQVREFTLTFSDGTKKSFVASYSDNGVANYQYFDFDEPIATDYIILTVDSGYVGTNYTTNVCLGEFAVY